MKLTVRFLKSTLNIKVYDDKFVEFLSKLVWRETLLIIIIVGSLHFINVTNGNEVQKMVPVDSNKLYYKYFK